MEYPGQILSSTDSCYGLTFLLVDSLGPVLSISLNLEDRSLLSFGVIIDS